MKLPDHPELLLLLVLLFPMGSAQVRALIAQILLSQIQAIYLTRQGEKKLDQQDDESATEDFWRAVWLDPHNTKAHAYLGLTRVYPVLISHQQGDRITSHGFTLEGEASPHAMVHLKVTYAPSLISNLFVQKEAETLLEWEINADDRGRFQVQVPPPSAANSGYRYRINVRMSSDEQWSETTQLSLIQQ